MPFDRERIKVKAADLAAKGVFIGTSSWKYEGWFGQLFTPARYEYRGKLAKTRFKPGTAFTEPLFVALQPSSVGVSENTPGLMRRMTERLLTSFGLLSP